MGGCRILEELGRGNVGIVYRAEDRDIGNRIVALKVMRRESLDDESIERFMHEAAAAGKLVTDYVVTVYRNGVHRPSRTSVTGQVEIGENEHYLVLEYVSLGNLAEYAQEFPDGRLDSIEAKRLLRQLAEGLRVAEREGIVHRDIKPANILLQDTGPSGPDVRIADFGAAKDARADLTLGNRAPMTPRFASPEQWEDRIVDARTDMYSLGASMFSLLVGRPAASGDEHCQIREYTVSQKYLSPAEAGPDLDIDEYLDGVIRRMTARNPEDRYPSFTALIEDLDGIDAGNAPTPIPNRWLRPFLAACLIMLSLLGVGAAAWATRSGATPDDYSDNEVSPPKPEDRSAKLEFDRRFGELEALEAKLSEKLNGSWHREQLDDLLEICKLEPSLDGVEIELKAEMAILEHVAIRLVQLRERIGQLEPSLREREPQWPDPDPLEVFKPLLGRVSEHQASLEGWSTRLEKVRDARRDFRALLHDCATTETARPIHFRSQLDRLSGQHAAIIPAKGSASYLDFLRVLREQVDRLVESHQAVVHLQRELNSAKPAALDILAEQVGAHVPRIKPAGVLLRKIRVAQRWRDSPGLKLLMLAVGLLRAEDPPGEPPWSDAPPWAAEPWQEFLADCAAEICRCCALRDHSHPRLMELLVRRTLAEKFLTAWPSFRVGSLGKLSRALTSQAVAERDFIERLRELGSLQSPWPRGYKIPEHLRAEHKDGIDYFYFGASGLGGESISSIRMVLLQLDSHPPRLVDVHPIHHGLFRVWARDVNSRDTMAFSLGSSIHNEGTTEHERGRLLVGAVSVEIAETFLAWYGARTRRPKQFIAADVWAQILAEATLDAAVRNKAELVSSTRKLPPIPINRLENGICHPALGLKIICLDEGRYVGLGPSTFRWRSDVGDRFTRGLQDREELSGAVKPYLGMQFELLLEPR